MYVLLLYHHQQQQHLLQRRGKSTSIALFVTSVLFLVVFQGNDTVLVWYECGRIRGTNTPYGCYKNVEAVWCTG
jgi:hypothetical protein